MTKIMTIYLAKIVTTALILVITIAMNKTKTL